MIVRDMILLSVFWTFGCNASESVPRGDIPTEKGSLSTNEDTPNSALEKLISLKAVVVELPHPGGPSLLVDLSHWRGKSEHLKLLSDVPGICALTVANFHPADFEAIAEIKSLKHLDVSEAELAPEQVEQLQKKLPHVEVFADYLLPQHRKLIYVDEGTN